MKISKGELFKVVSSVSFKHDGADAPRKLRLPVKNAGWVTTKDHEPGIKLMNSGGYLVVAECSALQNIEICPHCCLMYGKPFNKCEQCKNHVSFT
ncbi:hypothetical protein [Microcoleus sp. B3-D7]|uniref:hypothetical protein n=1 Tax=Microcoleus sp. B3-D7 TaxID=2818659 RepID=UPI002FD1103B